MSGPITDGEGRVLTLEDLIEALDKRERTPSNVPKVNTFHFNGERVSDWLDLVEQDLVGLPDEVKFKRILKYVLHVHHQEVEKVVNAGNDSWARFKDGMRRKYRLGDGLLTMADLEAMNRDDFTTVAAFVQEFKKKARKVHGILEEAQCAIFLGLLTAAEAAELISHGGGSEKLTWATIDKGVAEGSLDEVEQYQMRLQRRKRKERDATTSETPGVRRIVTDVLTQLGCGKDGVVQKKVVTVVQGRPGVTTVGSGLRSRMITRPPTPQGILAQTARTRGWAKAGASQEPPRKEPEPEKRKEVVEVEDDDEEEEEDERLRQEEDQRAEQRARKREAREEVEPIMRDVPPKKRKYTVRLEEGFDVERVIDRLLEGHNDLMTLKEILASAPKLRDGLKGRLSRRLVPSVHLSMILPKEAEWVETGTKMDWKCVACDTVDLVVKSSKCSAMVDTGAKTNIIREADAIRFGLEIDRSDCGILHGANCKAVFCGTASNVLIEVGRVKVRACFFVMPNVDHRILLGRSFLCRTGTLMFNKHGGTLILIMCDPACGNYEVSTCRNTGPRSVRNRPNPRSFTIEESEGERRRLFAEPEEEERIEAFPLSLSDVNKAMDIMATHEMADQDAIQAVREQVLECPQAGELDLVYRLPEGRRNPASDFTKAVMPRGGRGTRPPRRPSGASGGYERHGSHHRESTPVHDDGDIELFLDEFWGNADHMGWTMTQAIERLRGAGRFAELIAQIHREARTRPEVEARMQELRPSPVGPNGRPIRLEIGNAEEFIPAYEQFMHGHGILRDEWARTLPLWTGKAERPLARQIRDMARDWESGRVHLREAFRRLEPAQPRVERCQRTKRQRDPEPREARPSRGGQKALAKRE
ncbi:hypothetical protein CBR_g44550 [Chara braunii]|uniref:Peptidase A2 domain-containing protein n=1 Tax=Chara braunii TaxID=69332 RepID=A0A388LXP3_CHABU|nr:hypothetical protein CBR_g44550 [Chara braunii]|eukprot:GBG87094.1 hypothetical protein CBR_g44550 [Chara braunii]